MTNIMFVLSIYLPILLIIETNGSRTSRALTLSQTREWVVALIEDLEFASSLPDADPFHKALKDELIDKLANKITRKGFPFVDYFENNMNIFSKINPYDPSAIKYPYISTDKPSLAFGDTCDPLNHIQVDPLEVMDMENDEEMFFDAVKTWQSLVTSDPNIQICNVYLGLVCDPTVKECTCRPESEWVPKPGKCYLMPEAKCTFRDIHYPGIFASMIGLTYIKWFTRMFIHPMTHPICGVGTFCDTFDDSEPPKCWCLDTTTRPGCNEKITWEAAEPVEHKLEKLFIEINSPCTVLSVEVQNLVEAAVDPFEDMQHIYEELVRSNIYLCRFKREELCDPVELKCKKRCILSEDVRDKDNQCKLNHGELCHPTGSSDMDDECVKDAKCEQFEDIKTEKKEYACRCQITDESLTLPMKEYWYGGACLSKPRVFFLELLKPLESGLQGVEFRNTELILHDRLRLWEDLQTMKFGEACDLEQDKLSLEVVKYFGNLGELKEVEYEAILDKNLHQLVVKDGKPLCDHRNFLKCDPVTSKCGWMHLGLTMNRNTRKVRFAGGHVCNEAVETPKIFKGDDQLQGLPFQCIDNAFCVVDYSQPLEDTTDYKGDKANKKRCRCRRGFSGPDCDIKGELEDYNGDEKKKLADLIQFKMTNSVRQFQELCFINVEETFPRDQFMAVESSDLYELIFSLEPYLKSIDPLDAPEGLNFCDVRAYLRCTERVWHPVTHPQEIMAGCDCMPGFEWVGWPWEKRPHGCYISDGETCQTDLGLAGPEHKCASDRCEFETGFGVHKCQEDQTFLYFSDFKSGANPRQIKLAIVTGMCAISVANYRLIN